MSCTQNDIWKKQVLVAMGNRVGSIGSDVMKPVCYCLLCLLCKCHRGYMDTLNNLVNQKTIDSPQMTYFF